MSQPYDEKRPDASEGVRDTGVGAMSGPSARSDRAQAIAGPFTLRDTVVGGSVLVMLIGSLIPYVTDVITYRNMWTTFPLFFQGIGILLPLIVAGLFAFRRVSPKSHVRIGSLSVDQFASVVAVLAAIFFFLETASAFNASVLIALIGSLGLLAATTFAPFIPGFVADFFGREHIPAHLTARDAIVPEPKPAKPAAVAKPAVETEEALARPSAAEPVAAEPETSVAQSQPGAVVHAPSGSGATSQSTKRTSDSADGRSHKAEPSATDAVALSTKTPAGPETAGSEDSASAASWDATPSSVQVAAASPTRTSETEEAEVGTSETPGSAPSEATESDVAGASEAAESDAAGASEAAESDAAGASEAEGSPSGTDYTVASDVNAEAQHSGPSAATSTDEPGHDNSSSSDPATAIHPVIARESASEPISATRSHEEEPVIEAFWFAVGSARPVVDESTGKKLFTFEPGDWELCLEDRGNEFLVQNKHTGQTGIMKDLSDIQIPPAEDVSSRRG